MRYRNCDRVTVFFIEEWGGILLSEKRRDDLRNIAIIAHVDHGKTTLVNQLLKQSDTLPEHMNLEDRAMDSKCH